MRTTVTLGDLKARYPDASLTLKFPLLESGGVRPVAFRPTHRIETKLPDQRILVDYVRLIVPGRDGDIVHASLDALDFWAAATPSDYNTLAHGYSVVSVPTFGYQPSAKVWWPYICPEPVWTKATVTASEVIYEPLEEAMDYSQASSPLIEGQGVYFVQASSGGPIKIGFSTDARRRKDELQTAQADPLCFLAFLPGATEEDERALHNRFFHFRLKGEWFEEKPVVEWLRSRGYMR